MFRKRLYVTILNKRGTDRKEAREIVLEHLKELSFIEQAKASYVGLLEKEVKRDYEIERIYDRINLDDLNL